VWVKFVLPTQPNQLFDAGSSAEGSKEAEEAPGVEPSRINSSLPPSPE